MRYFEYRAISNKNVGTFSIYNLAKQNLSRYLELRYLELRYLELTFDSLGQITIFISNVS